jgi:hypothetical protein
LSTLGDQILLETHHKFCEILPYLVNHGNLFRRFLHNKILCHFSLCLYVNLLYTLMIPLKTCLASGVALIFLSKQSFLTLAILLGAFVFHRHPQMLQGLAG